MVFIYCIPCTWWPTRAATATVIRTAMVDFIMSGMILLKFVGRLSFWEFLKEYDRVRVQSPSRFVKVQLYAQMSVWTSFYTKWFPACSFKLYSYLVLLTSPFTSCGRLALAYNIIDRFIIFYTSNYWCSTLLMTLHLCHSWHGFIRDSEAEWGF